MHKRDPVVVELELHGIEMEKAFMWGGEQSRYLNALDRIRSGSVRPEDVHIILTEPSPASGVADDD